MHIPMFKKKSFKRVFFRKKGKKKKLKVSNLRHQNNEFDNYSPVLGDSYFNTPKKTIFVSRPSCTE